MRLPMCPIQTRGERGLRVCPPQEHFARVNRDCCGGAFVRLEFTSVAGDGGSNTHGPALYGMVFPEKSESGGAKVRRSESSFKGGLMTSRGQRKANGHLDLAESPAHLMRRCHQFYGDLYSRESGAQDLTKQQYLVLLALEHHEGKGSARQRSWRRRASIVRPSPRWSAACSNAAIISRERVKDDQRANAVAITQTGRKALRGARLAAGRAEKAFLEVLPAGERGRFIKSLAAIAAAADTFATNGASHPSAEPDPAADPTSAVTGRSRS